MLSSLKPPHNPEPSKGTGGYLDYLFDKDAKAKQTEEEAVLKAKIDSNKLRADVTSQTLTKSKQNRSKKYPYVYGPKLPQLDSKHLYHLDEVTNSDENLTLIEHPNQPSLPSSIPKRDKKQKKASEKIKGKLQGLNDKQDSLINRTSLYNDIYGSESEKKEVTQITNPIKKPFYKFIGRIKNDADLKEGKKTRYIASQPKELFWNKAQKEPVAENEEPDAEFASAKDIPTTLDPKFADENLVSEEQSENAVEGTKNNASLTEEDPVETIENAESDAFDKEKQEVPTLDEGTNLSSDDLEAAYAKENEEGPFPLEPAMHELSLNRTRTAEEIESDIHENLEGPVPLDPSIHELSLNKTRTAEEIESDIQENVAGPDCPLEDNPGESNHNDVQSSISYNPVFFVKKKDTKVMKEKFDTPIQSIGARFKNLKAYTLQKQQENSDNLGNLSELKLQQDEDTQKLSILLDEVIDLQEKCQPLHFKKLDELERLNQLSMFHHKVDLYKHSQEKLQINKKEFEKLQRHKLRDLNREERSNIRKQRVLQKEQRDLKKEELRGLRRHHRKLKHFEEMKKKFVTAVPSQDFDLADDEAEPDTIPTEPTASHQDLNIAEAEPAAAPVEPAVSSGEAGLSNVTTSASAKDDGETEQKPDSSELEDDNNLTKEYVEPDTEEVYDRKIKEIGQEFSYISKEPLISHEEEKELESLKCSLNEKKEEINSLTKSLNGIAADMNVKLNLVSQFQPPADSKVPSPSLEDIRAPVLSSSIPIIDKDFAIATDDEFQLAPPSDISDIAEYVPKTSSEESTLSALQISSSDIGEETDSESEGESDNHIPIGYKNVLPKRGFLRSVTYTTATAAALKNAVVPSAYDQWVIHEGDGPDEIPTGYKGVLPQRKKLLSIPYDLGTAKHLGNASIPAVYDKWVIHEGTGPDEIPTGYKGVLPQRKFLNSVVYDDSSAKHLGNARVPEIYSTWEPKEGSGSDDIPKGFKGVLPRRHNLKTAAFDISSAAAMGAAAVPSVYKNWSVKQVASDAAEKESKNIENDDYSTYTEEEIVTVSSKYKLNDEVL